jgi:hypothetical protein
MAKREESAGIGLYDNRHGRLDADASEVSDQHTCQRVITTWRHRMYVFKY